MCFIFYDNVQVNVRSVGAGAPGAGRRSNPRDAPHPPPRHTMVNSDVSQTLQLAESVRQWSSQAVTAQLDALDDYLQHQSCFLGRTLRELLVVFASGEWHSRVSTCASCCRGVRARETSSPSHLVYTSRKWLCLFFLLPPESPLPPRVPTLHLQKTIKRRHSLDYL